MVDYLVIKVQLWQDLCRNAHSKLHKFVNSESSRGAAPRPPPNASELQGFAPGCRYAGALMQESGPRPYRGFSRYTPAIKKQLPTCGKNNDSIRIWLCPAERFLSLRNWLCPIDPLIKSLRLLCPPPIFFPGVLSVHLEICWHMSDDNHVISTDKVSEQNMKEIAVF